MHVPEPGSQSCDGPQYGDRTWMLGEMEEHTTPLPGAA